MLRLGLGEPADNRPGGNFPDVLHLGQGLHIRCHEVFQVTKGRCQNPGSLCSHLTDAKAVNQPAHILLLTGFNGSKQIIGSGVPLLPQGFQVVQGQIVNICRGFEIPFFNQGIHNGTAKAINIHGIPADKVGKVPAQLGRALGAGAAKERPVLLPLCGGTAYGAAGRKPIGLGVFRPLGKVNLQDFRDNLSGLANQHRISDADVPLGDKVLIMKGCIGDGGSSQPHRAHHCLGGEHTGSSHLHHNILHHRGLDFRGILVGSGPSGELGCGAQLLPQSQGIHLDYGTVNVTGQVLPVFIDGLHRLANLLGGGKNLAGNDLEMQIPQVPEGLAVGLKFHTLRQLDIENQNIQSPFGSNLGVQLPQRAGSCISGVGEKGLPFCLLLFVELAEALLGHEHLSPHNQPGRSIGNGHGNGRDGFQVFRHILPHHAVTPGRAPDKQAIFIFQGNGKAVYLRLHGKGGSRVLFQNFRKKILQLLHGKHILQAHKGHGMGDFLKLAQSRASYPLGRAIRLLPLGVLGLQGFQLPQKLIVFKVLHLGIVQHIVLVARLVQQAGQLPDSLFRFHITLRFVVMYPAPAR